MNKYVCLLIIALSCAFRSFAITPEDVEYRGADGRILTVIDPAGLLRPEVRAQVSDSLEQLRLRSTTEVEVVIAPDLDGMSPQQWCEKLFTRLKIGKEKEDNGLLVMISPGARQAFIMPGYGMEGVFTDIACKKIAENAIRPAMKEGNLDAAVLNSTRLISAAIDDPAVAEELRSDQAEKYNGALESLDKEVFMTFLRWFCGTLFLISAVWFLICMVRSRKFPTNYTKAQMFRSKLTGFFILGLCSLGAGLIFFALVFLLYRYWRTKRVVCPTCSSRMKRLPEDKDNELLSPSQDLEERLNTIDYDVWECPECHTIERFPFRVPQKKYTECPNCHTVAMSLESDAVLRQPTTRTEGQGVRTYSCRYCHNSISKPYRIPRKEDAAGALATAAVLGAAAGRRGGGGGFGGGGFGGFGGFGGGATGGGGSGTSW